MSVMVELDAKTLTELETHFDITKFSKAATGVKGELATPEEVVAHLRELRPEVAIIENELFTAESFAAAAPDLKLLACSRATPTNIDIAAAANADVIVTNAPGRNANAVVEMTIGFIISLARFIPQTHRLIMDKKLTVRPGTPLDDKDILWQNAALTYNPYTLYRGMEIEERTLGLIGFGIIGRMLTPKVKALGMHVVCYDPFVDKDSIAADGAVKIDSLEELLSSSDFVSLHAKPTAQTRGMIGWEQLNIMKRDAYLINTSRGALLDQDALVRALKEKVIAGAALDVFEREPLFDDSPLLGLDNLIMTPHIGGATKDTVRHQSRIVLANIRAYLEDMEPPNTCKAK